MGETGEGSGGNGGGNWECGTPLSTPSIKEAKKSNLKPKPIKKKQINEDA